MSVSKDFVRRIFSNKLTQEKLDLLYTLITELDLVVPNPVTRYELKEFDKVLKETAQEAKFENDPKCWTQLELMENIWKRNRKKFVDPDPHLLPQLLKFNF